ncbi:ATP-grasp domain-containing protein [Azospirillum sp. A39]|uniref:ATP-grasp domain-containing protein n=1 Tax=Azospirillum sp. A39 TaxID=3462279 RepID=UPI0040452095
MPPPKNLLILATASASPGLAQLPKALARAGFGVGAVAPEGGLILATRYLSVAAGLPGTLDTPAYVDAMLGVMRLWSFDAIVAGDDWSVRYLNAIAGQADEGRVPAPLAEVVLRSAVPRPHRPVIETKSGVIELARGLGLTVPEQIRPASAEAVRAFCREHGLPVVVKSDYSASGAGVLVLNDEERAVRAALGHNPGCRVPWSPEILMVQRLIRGTPASVALACRDGAVLAAFCYATVRANPEPTGAATVIRTIDRPDMVAAAGRLVEALRLTGIVGFDFVVEEGTGVAHLLELNPRPPQSAHLGSLVGADLCAALAGAPAGRAEPDRTIALFPGEWIRDPESPYLNSALHPVPWEDVALLTAIMARPPAARRPGQRLPATVSFRLAPSP